MPPRRPIRIGDSTRGLRLVIVLVVMLCSVAALTAANWSQLNRFFGTYREREDIRKTVEMRKARIRALETEKRQLEMGMFEVEKAVREADIVVGPGENLIRIKPAESSSSATVSGLERPPGRNSR